MSNILPQDNSFLNTILNTFINKSDSWEEVFKNKGAQLIESLFVNSLHALDDLFFHSDDRKRAYLSKDKQTRTLVTSFGTFTFTRRRYIHKDTNKSFFYIDFLLGLNKYQRVTNETIALILHNVSFNHDSYRRASEPFGLSKSFVYNTIKKLNPEVHMPFLKKVISCDNLHIVVDEDHVALQKKNKEKKDNSVNSYMLRHATIFTDLKKVSKNRNQLINRMIFTQLENETTDDFAQRINEFILENYKVKDNVFVYGDGASWIKTLADEVAGIYIHDKFHMKQALFKICGGKHNTITRNILESYLEADDKEEFTKVAKALLGDQPSEHKEKQLRYIRNSWEAYQKNFKIKETLVCCAEGINSHYFSEYFSSRPKGFNKSNLHKLGYLLAHSHSHYDIREHFINHIETFIKRDKIHNQYKGKTNLIRDNVPVIKEGITKGIYTALVNIIH